jgi:hypothetical protein
MTEWIADKAILIGTVVLVLNGLAFTFGPVIW